MIRKIISDTESLFTFLTIVSITIICASLLNRYFLNKFNHVIKNRKIDGTRFMFLKHVVVLIVYLVGIGWALLVLPITKTFAHTFFAGAGVTTLILGLASQQILGNMISGVFIVMNKSFRIDDVIEIQGHKGRVSEITWHDTVIHTDAGEKIVVPNSLLTSNAFISFGRVKRKDG